MNWITRWKRIGIKVKQIFKKPGLAISILFVKRKNFVLCIIYNGNCTALAILTSNIFFTRLSNCLIVTWPRDFLVTYG